MAMQYIREQDFKKYVREHLGLDYMTTHMNKWSSTASTSTEPVYRRYAWPFMDTDKESDDKVEEVEDEAEVFHFDPEELVTK